MTNQPAMPLSTKVFIAMVLGICLGYGVQFCQSSLPGLTHMLTEVVEVIGVSYIKLLQMVVIPLIFVSLLSASVSIEDASSLKKISLTVITLLLATTAVAASISMIVTLAFHLNATDIVQGKDEISRGVALLSMLNGLNHTEVGQLIINFIPSNVFYDLAGMRPTSTVAVVVIASLLSLAVHRMTLASPEQATLFKQGLSVIHDVVLHWVRLILTLTPIGVFALMTKMMATSSLLKMMLLLKFLLASYVALILMFCVHLVMVSLAGVSPLYFIRRMFPLLTFAFTSRSSAGSIPLNVETQKQWFGVSGQIANFAASFGSIMGQNGCAGVYPAMLAVMIAPSVGIDPMSAQFLLMVLLVVTISSIGVAGVGGGATFAALMVLSTLNMPVTLAALLISIEPLIDMGRTALNVSGSAVSGIITQRLLLQQDK